MKNSVSVGFEEVLTVDELAARLRLRSPTVRKMARAKEIPGFKLCGDWRFIWAAVAAKITEKKESEPQGR